MNRRQFICGSCGLAATASLPSVADDQVEFSSRGKFERLALAMRNMRVGASAPFSILHISDTHLTAAYAHEAVAVSGQVALRARIFGGKQEEAFRDSLAWAKEHVDYVLHTGDLIDFQSEANFDLVKKYCGCAVFGSVGNHEFYTYRPEEIRTQQESFKDCSWPVLKANLPVDARFSSKVVNGVNFVCLDDSFGTVAPEQVERFHMEVKRGLPIVLCMHTPFFTDDLWLMFARYWDLKGGLFRTTEVPESALGLKRWCDDVVTKDFIAYLKSERLLKGILTGHAHVAMQDRFSETAMEYVVGGNFMFHGQEILFT